MIMVPHCRYAIMDDYDLSINLDSENPGAPAFLNGDTTVRWKLQDRKKFYRGTYNFKGRRMRTWKWSIEEDDYISEKESSWPDKYNILSPEEVKLLYNPLPQDLPTMKKDLLVHMAAYEGNVDRYARLAPRWPMEGVERVCVIRGIYHNTMFARFWADEIKRNPRRVQALKFSGLSFIKQAISARRIMINDVEEFYNGWPDDEPQPHVIWKPLQPCEDTLKLLAERVPSMKKTAAVACIFCDYEEMYKEINCTPHPDLATAAKESRNPFYLRDIEQKAAEQGIDLYEKYDEPMWLSESLEALTSHRMSAHLQNGIMPEWRDGYWGRFDGVFGLGDVLEESSVQLYVWASPEKLRLIDICALQCPCPARYYPDFDENWKDYVEHAREVKEEAKFMAAVEARRVRQPGESTEAWRARVSAEFCESRKATRAGVPGWVEAARKTKEKYEAIKAREAREAEETIEKEVIEQEVPPEPSSSLD
ncbi:hypothetical protein FQN49_005451 [Arthroderma sp. PD_2]|nr:hypothetical protein FQN49_005451 [Arthroderma sp. PD_2]